MPFRRVQPGRDRVVFDDVTSPVLNGIASLGATLAELGPRIQAQRMEREAAEREQQRYADARNMKLAGSGVDVGDPQLDQLAAQFRSQMELDQAAKGLDADWRRSQMENLSADNARANAAESRLDALSRAQMANQVADNARQDQQHELTNAANFGVVPERPDFVTMPTDRERQLWHLAEQGEQDREDKRQQQALAGMMKLGGVGTSGAGRIAGATRIRTAAGTVLIDPKTNRRIGIVDDATGEVTLDADAPPAPAAEPGPVQFPTPEPPAQGFWTMRRSGAPGAAATLGDVLSGRWYGQGEQLPTEAAPATAPASPAPAAMNVDGIPQARSASALPYAGQRQPAPKVATAAEILDAAQATGRSPAQVRAHLASRGYSFTD